MKLAPGVSNKNVMKLMDAHPLALIMLILVFFFFIKYLFFKLKTLYINSALFAAVIIDPLSAISDAVLTAAATGVIIFIFRDKLKTWIEGNNITTTSHFIDIEDCLRLLTDQIGTYKNKVNRAHITAVAPLLFTPEYINYVIEKNSNDTEKSNQKLIRVSRKLEDYNKIFKEIIQSDEGSYDKTTIGKTSISKLDKATYKSLEELYDFNTEVPPGTTEIGFQKSLTEHAVYIFGSCNKFPNSEPDKFHFMMVVHFANQYKNLCGYICFEEKIISQNYEFIRFKKRDIDAEIVTNHVTQAKPEDWVLFKNKIRTFYLDN